MAKLPDHFNFGEIDGLTMEEFVIKIQRMYMDLAEAVNNKPDLVQRTVDGQAGDTFLSQGTFNINLSTNKVEMLTNHTNPTTVVWTQLS